jgi:site-specific DNA recombinase
MAEVVAGLSEVSAASTKRALDLVAQVRIGRGALQVDLGPAALAAVAGLKPTDLAPSSLSFEAPFSCRRRGVEMRIVSGERAAVPDPTLLRALRNAHRWTEALKSGTPLGKLASSEGVSERYLARIGPLAGLSPRIQKGIVEGSQPVDLTLERLIRMTLPLAWDAQEKLLGIKH